jgi:hypothetical protein
MPALTRKGDDARGRAAVLGETESTGEGWNMNRQKEMGFQLQICNTLIG